MNKENRLPQRKNIRLDYNYSLPGAYFITICTKDKKNYFWNKSIDPQNFEWYSTDEMHIRPKNLPLSNFGKIVSEELENWNSTYSNVALHSYVIMPNHLHIMVVISADKSDESQIAPTIDRMIKQFKGSATKKIGKSIWQKSYIEHIIRNKEDFEIRLNYIFQNPSKWNCDELYTEE